MSKKSDDIYRIVVKCHLSIYDKGVIRLLREYVRFKKVLIPQVSQAVRQVIKKKELHIYAQQKWMIDKKLREYLKNLPYHPMPFHNQSVWIEERDGKFYIHFKTAEGEAVCRLYVPHNSRRDPYKYVRLIRKAVGKDNPVLGQVELIEDRSNGYINCHITLRLPKPRPYIPRGWLGVDIGWRKLAVSIIVYNDGKICKPTIYGKQYRRQIIELRRILKNWQRSNRNWKKWNYRLKNTIKYATGVVAKQIVSKAKKYRLGIALEDLSFKSVTKGYIIPRYKLITAIKTLCIRQGIPYIQINPKYTSTTCPKCGYQDKENRIDSRFICKKCGYNADADIVGAINIAKKALKNAPQMKG